MNDFFVLCALGVSLTYLNNKIYLEIGLIIMYYLFMGSIKTCKTHLFGAAHTCKFHY